MMRILFSSLAVVIFLLFVAFPVNPQEVTKEKTGEEKQEVIKKKINDLCELASKKTDNYESEFVKEVLKIGSDSKEILEMRLKIEPSNQVKKFISSALSALEKLGIILKHIPEQTVKDYPDAIYWLAINLSSEFLTELQKTLENTEFEPTRLFLIHSLLNSINNALQTSKSEVDKVFYITLLNIIRSQYMVQATKLIAKLINCKYPEVKAKVLELLGIFRAKEYISDILASLIGEKSEYIICQALIALGKIGTEADAKYIVNFLKNDSKNIKIAAIIALRFLKAKNYETELIQLLKGTNDVEVIKEVLHTLMIINSQKLTTEVAKLLDNANTFLPALQILQLTRADKNYVEKIRKVFFAKKDKEAFKVVKNLSDKSGNNEEYPEDFSLREVKPYVIVALARLGDKKSQNEIMKLSTSEDDKIQVAVIKAIGFYKDSTKIPWLLEKLRSENIDIINAVEFSLSMINPKSLPGITKLLADKDNNMIKSRALKLIAKLRLKGYNEEIYKLIQVADTQLKKIAIETLGYTSGDEDFLLKLTEDKDGEIVASAIKSLTRLGSSKLTAENVKKILRNVQTLSVKIAIIDAAYYLNLSNAKAILLDVIKNEPYSSLKQQAAFYLKKFADSGDKEVKRNLLENLKSSDVDTKFASAIALVYFNDKSACHILFTDFASLKYLSEESPEFLNMFRNPNLTNTLKSKTVKNIPYIYGSLKNILDEFSKLSNLEVEYEYIPMEMLLDERIIDVSDNPSLYSLLIRIKSAYYAKFNFVFDPKSEIIRCLPSDEADADWFLWYNEFKKNVKH